MKKIGKYLTPVLPFLLALGVQIIGAFFAMFIYGAVKGVQLASQGGLDESSLENIVNGAQDPEFLLLLSALFAIIDIIIFGIWLKKLKKREEEPVTPGRLSLKGVLMLIVMGLCLQIALSIVLTLISGLRPDWFEEYGELMEQLGMGNTPISFLYIGLIGPIAEELIFRGVAFQKAKKVMPFIAANIFQALLFGIYHMNLIQGLYAFAIGLCFGLVRYAFHSLTASILLHMSVNISGMLLSYVLTDDMLTSPLLGGLLFLVTAAAIGACLVYFIKMVKNQKTEEPPIYTFDEN